jgi:hypothetical protein
MNLEEFEIDGKKVILDNNFSEDETGIAFYNDEEDDEIDLDKTHQIDIVYDPASLENTLTDIFKDDSHE